MRTLEELRLLAGAEFNQLLASDPELKRLASPELDKALDVRVLLEVLGLGDWRIGNLPVRPLTAAKWAFLWALDNPIVTGDKLTETDLDVALYILAIPDLRDIPCGLSGIPAEAAGRARATGLDMKEVTAELWSVVRGAFRPLDILQENAESSDDEPPRYDGVWLASIAGVAAREANTGVAVCMYRMSLSAVCAYYASWRRRESADGGKFRYRPGAAVTAAITARIEELEEEFLTRSKKE